MKGDAATWLRDVSRHRNLTGWGAALPPIRLQFSPKEPYGSGLGRAGVGAAAGPWQSYPQQHQPARGATAARPQRVMAQQFRGGPVLCNRDLHFLFGIAARIKKKPNKTSKKAGSRSAAETVIAAWYMCIFVIWNSGGWMTDDATSKKGIMFRRTRPRLPLNRHTTAPLPAPGSQHPAPRHVSDGAEPPGKTGRVLAEADPTRSSSLPVIR